VIATQSRREKSLPALPILLAMLDVAATVVYDL